MDLSDIPHEQWDYSLQQFTSESDCSYSNDIFEFAKGEIQPFEPIYQNEIPDIERPLGSNGAFNIDDKGYLNTQNMHQFELGPQIIMPLALRYPELPDSHQGFEQCSIPSGFPSENMCNEIPKMEESFGDNMLALTTFDPFYNTEGISVISQFTDHSPPVSPSLEPYKESLNSWLKQFTTDGLETSCDDMYNTTDMSDCGPGLSDNNYQSNPSERASVFPEENELSGLSTNTNTWVPSFALINGYDLKDTESTMQSNGEERENALRMREKGRGLEGASKKKGKMRRKESREERESKRVRPIREERESERRQSNRVSKPPVRFMDEWSKPKGMSRKTSKRPKNESRILKKKVKIYLAPKVSPVMANMKSWKSCKH